MTDKTKYVLGRRLADELIQKQHNGFARHSCSNCFEHLPFPLAVLNSQRQIIFSNKMFSKVLGRPQAGEPLGQRLGEAFECIYSSVGENGCGTSEHCRECGNLKAILASIKEKAESECECQLLLNTPEGISARDYRVYVAPWESDEIYYVVSLVDIGDQKRRELLERVFFHDVLNAVGGAQGLVGLLLEEASGEMKEMVGLLSSSLFGLAEEVKKQKDMIALEKSEYVVKPMTLMALEILQHIADEYKAHLLAFDKEIIIDDTSDNVSVKADYTLLRRVIINMLVNALEAIPEGESVTMGVSNENSFARFWVHNSTVMPESTRLQVFKRSFSTKGQGRGLGTYSIKLLTENYLEGRTGFSTGDQGTTFWVELPASASC